VSDVYALVRSIRANRWPRNRHFDEHATPDGVAARRLNRFLRAIERDLLRAARVEVRRDADGFVISMEFPEVRLTRKVALSAEEHALLVEDQRLRPLLGV
jgi:hypothetical protein